MWICTDAGRRHRISLPQSPWHMRKEITKGLMAAHGSLIRSI